MHIKAFHSLAFWIGYFVARVVFHRHTHIIDHMRNLGAL